MAYDDKMCQRKRNFEEKSKKDDVKRNGNKGRYRKTTWWS